MSRSAFCSGSECIDRIARRGPAQMRLEGLAVDYVHRMQEEARDILFHAHVVEDGHMGVGVKLDEDVYVAIRAVVAASHRAEQRGMRDPASPQSAFGAAQRVQSLFAVHVLIVAKLAPSAL